MDERKTTLEPDFCEVSLRRIDEALNTTAGAMLSLEQFDEVTRLRRSIRGYCENGREDEARAAVEAAMAILRPHINSRL